MGDILILGLPFGSFIGIDDEIKQINKHFKGIKHLKKGVHFISYCIQSKDGAVGSKYSILLYIRNQDFMILKYNEMSEELEIVQNDQDLSLQYETYKKNHYQYMMNYEQVTETFNKKITFITKLLLKKLSNIQYKSFIRNEMAYCIYIYPYMSFKLMPYEISNSDYSTPQFTINFTQILFNKYNVVSTDISVITEQQMDSSDNLEILLNAENFDLLGEFQLIYLIFTSGGIYELFFYWKRIIILMCYCDKFLEKFCSLFLLFIDELGNQINDNILEEIFESSETNFMKSSLQRLYENINLKNNQKLKEKVTKLKSIVYVKYKWVLLPYEDFNIEKYDSNDEDAPVIVDFED